MLSTELCVYFAILFSLYLNLLIINGQEKKNCYMSCLLQQMLKLQVMYKWNDLVYGHFLDICINDMFTGL